MFFFINKKMKEEFDPTFLFQCNSKDDRKRNEKEVDYLYPKERDRYMKKMMLEFLKNELKFHEEEILNHYFYDFFECIIKDMAIEARRNKMDSRMHYLGDGYSVISFRIGEQVITIGRYKNHNKCLIADEHLIHLKLNRTFEILNDFKEMLTIQVMNYVDTKSITTEDLYQIYRHFREKGYFWVDSKIDNIGRLLKPNENPYPNLSETGRIYLGTHETSQIVLPKGEVVIFDIDGIIPESEFSKIDWPLKENRSLKALEKRYQYEKGKL